MFPRFCARCGHCLTEQLLPGDHRKRQVCPACGFVAYRNAKPCAGVLPTQNGQVLLARRGVPPYLGCWDIVGGFMEHDEAPEDAALREAREETGAVMELLDLLGVYLDGSGYGPEGDTTLNVYYVARILQGDPQPADDVAELRWFAAGELPHDMAFPGHTHRVLADWMRWTQGPAARL